MQRISISNLQSKYIELRKAKLVKKGMLNMKKAGEPLAMFFAVSFLISLRFTIRRMVKKYSGVKL